jgi:hypothetical protein
MNTLTVQQVSGAGSGATLPQAVKFAAISLRKYRYLHIDTRTHTEHFNFRFRSSDYKAITLI